MTDETFDLRDVLLGRKYPEGQVRIWLDEEPWYELDALEKKQATLLSATDPEFKRTEKRIKEVQKQIDAEAYTVHIRGISPRSGEHIISEALSEIPFKRDVYGRDDELQQIKRNRLISELSFAKHLVKIVSPAGIEQVATDDNRREIAAAILGEAPQTAIKTIDDAIAAVSRQFAEKQAEYANPDFS